MVITSLEGPEQKAGETGRKHGRNAKTKVYIDWTYAFPLYRSDVRALGLEEGMELTKDIYDRLIKELIYPRAKQKALDLLKFQDRTKEELRRKLKEQLYPEDIIDQTIHYVMEYGFVNDERYVASYVRTRMNSKSKRSLHSELLAKGINKEIIDTILTSEYEEQVEDPELEAIKKALGKQSVNLRELTWEEKQKLTAKLYRRGFDLDKIKKFLELDSFPYE